MSETVYYVNGRCYSCGGTARTGLRVSYCRGCGKPVGTMLWVSEESESAQHVERLAATSAGATENDNARS